MQARHFAEAQQKALAGTAQLPLVALGSTAASERLPLSQVFPTDVFAACLTRPLEMALELSLESARGHGCLLSAAEMIELLPGTAAERRSPLGELHWILTGVTDAIAWQLLPTPLFSRLFRQDVTLSALLRNFVLASRVMGRLQCSVVSEPPLPPSHAHPLWSQWDVTVSHCLARLHGHSALSPQPSPFFPDALTSFKLEVDAAAQRPPPHDRLHRGAGATRLLPVVLQALLSQSFRLLALQLLHAFLCLGPWAVDQVLRVGIFQYFAKLLHSAVPFTVRGVKRRRSHLGTSLSCCTRPSPSCGRRCCTCGRWCCRTSPRVRWSASRRTAMPTSSRCSATRGGCRRQSVGSSWPCRGATSCSPSLCLAASAAATSRHKPPASPRACRTSA